MSADQLEQTWLVSSSSSFASTLYSFSEVISPAGTMALYTLQLYWNSHFSNHVE